jgi:acyl transferase domain-containing protein
VSRAPIAIIGMAGRFPDASDMDTFWDNLVAGREAIHRIPEPLVDARRDGSGLLPESFVPMGSRLADTEWFDPRFFGLSLRDARLMDPQQRLFIEHTWAAIEDAGYDPHRLGRRVAVYAGGGPSRHVLDALDQFGHDGGTLFEVVATGVANAMAMRVSHLFGFTGESIYLYAACATSLVAVDLACRALLEGRADVAVAGGTALWLPQQEGWDYVEGMILSRDGHVRAFDASASGTVWGNGVGVVVLKPLEAALRDRDPVRAIILGSAHNNDGGIGKRSFAAPSAEGQADAIRSAYLEAAVSPSTVSLVEAHGTGTPIGDPLEVESLHAVFGRGRGPRTVRLGSVKTNIGHLDPAAGVASLAKVVLALEHKRVPPSLHFERPNPAIDFDAGPFYVNTEAEVWEPLPGVPRRAGINSFGVGGANGHLILQEAPPSASIPGVRPAVVPLSARSGEALDQMAAALARAVEQSEVEPADVAYTHAFGRTPLPVRAAVVARSRADLVRGLRGSLAKSAMRARPSVGFLFPGQGARLAGMARELYEREEGFRRDLEDCAALLEGQLDLLGLLYEAEPEVASLRRTSVAQPVLFAVSFALARWWMEAGVQPAAMLGHSVGELVCATLAGVLDPADALELVAARGRLMESQPEGAMLAVALSEAQARELLAHELELAAVNGPRQCVLAGPVPAVEQLERTLAGHGLAATRLHTSHAFHSASMQPAADAFADEVARFRLSPPALPFVSCLTGGWIQPQEATDPRYWARQLRSTVRFSDGLRTLREAGHRLLVEVGAGQLARSAAEDPERPPDEVWLSSLARGGRSDHEALFGAAGALWAHGVELRWEAVTDPGRRRLRLPTYPFEREWCALYAPGEEYRLVQRALGARKLQWPGSAELPELPEVPENPVPPEHESEEERVIASLFAQALGCSTIGRDDDVIELGAHSLLLVSVSHQLRSALGVNVPAALVFEHPTPRALAAAIARLRATPELER